MKIKVVMIFTCLLFLLGCGKRDNEIDKEMQSLIRSEDPYLVITEQMLPELPYIEYQNMEEGDISMVHTPLLYDKNVYQMVEFYDSNLEVCKDRYIMFLGESDAQWEQSTSLMEYRRPSNQAEIVDLLVIEGHGLYIKWYDHEKRETYIEKYQTSMENTQVIKVPEECENGSLFFDLNQKAYGYDLGLPTSHWYCLDEDYHISDINDFKGMIYDCLCTDDGVMLYGGNHESLKVLNIATRDYILDVDMEVMPADFSMLYSENQFYIIDTQNITRIKEGERETICTFLKRDYILDEVYGAETGDQGEINILTSMEGRLFILKVHNQNDYTVSEKQEIELVLYSKSDSSLQQAVARFNRNNNMYHIILTCPELKEREAFINRLQMEIAAGRGPDLIDSYLLSQGLSAYGEKGYLEQLDELLEDEECFVPAVLDYCKINNHLYMAPYGCSLITTAYSKAVVGEKKTFSLTELMELTVWSGREVLCNSTQAAAIIVTYGLEDRMNPTYIDWKNNKSNLNETPFKELMEFAVRYCNSKEISLPRLVKEQQMVATTTYLSNLETINYLKACFPEGMIMTGFPSTYEMNVGLTAHGYALNVNSKCKEGAIAFLRYLMSEECQQNKLNVFRISPLDFQGGMPIRWTAIDYMLGKSTNLRKEEGACERDGIRYEYDPLDESDVEQIRYLFEHAHVGTHDGPSFGNIIYEEMPAYINGDKTVQQVAEIIHRRMQLYIDETCK